MMQYFSLKGQTFASVQGISWV